MLHFFHRVGCLFFLILSVSSLASIRSGLAGSEIIESNGVSLEVVYPGNSTLNARVNVRVPNAVNSLQKFHRLNAVLGAPNDPHSKVTRIQNTYSDFLRAAVVQKSAFTLVHANEHLFVVNKEGEWLEIARVDESIQSWGIHRVVIPYGGIVGVPPNHAPRIMAMAEVIFIRTLSDRRERTIQVFVIPYEKNRLQDSMFKSEPIPFSDDFMNYQTDGRFGWKLSKNDDVGFALDLPANNSDRWTLSSLSTIGDEVLAYSRDDDATESQEGAQAATPKLLAAPRNTGPSVLFKNEDYIQRLSNFEEEYNKVVIGQTKVAARLVQALYAHAGNPELRSKPFSVILVGPKRTGKTMTGKAMAKILYGNAKKSITIALGSIQNESEMRNVFGSPKSYIGSDKPGQLELAVNQLMDRDLVARGVIVLDEFSDMGGGRAESRAMKTSLLKSFYELIHEGRLYSTVTSKYIDVSQIAFILTGNDGAVLFDGVPNEKAKQLRHDENSDRIQVEKMLESTGVPGPLLKRVDDVILVEPMSREKARRIVLETLLPEFKQAFLNEYSVEIEFGPSETDFTNILVTEYFGSDDGVAGIRDLVHLRIGALVSRALIENRKELNGVAKRKMKIEWKSITQLGVTVNLPNETRSYEQDLTTYRTPRPLLETDMDDPFDDERLAQRIGNLPDELRKRVFGQDEILDSLVEMIRAKVYDPSTGMQRPQAAFLVGTTGSGKTETAKALAQSLYGTEAKKHLEILPMGEYVDKAEFNKFLGVAPGYSGSDRESDLEAALRKLLSVGGGILVLDEISNVGGSSAELKNQLCKALYNMKEEGKWTSPRTGTTYDLSSIFILMTGNDAEEFFQGAFAYSDQMRQGIWEEFAQRDALEEILIKKGFSAAFLGRLDGVFLQRPQGLKALEQIVQKKFLGPALAMYQEAHPGLTFEVEEKFLTQFTETFFAHGRGARSLRSVIDQYLKGIVTDALLFARANGIKKGSAMKLHLAFKDNWEGLVFREETTPEKREVFLNAGLMWESGSHAFTKNVSSVTPEKPLYDRIRSDATAYHEAGHAVANLPSWTGERVKYITIRGGGSIMGYASYDRIPGTASQDRNAAVGKMASLMAGQLAEMMMGFPKEAGWWNDLKEIRKTARQVIMVWGLVPELVGIRVDKDENPILNDFQSKVYRREFKRLLRDAFNFAQERLTKHWSQIEQVRDLLMNDGVVTQKQYNDIMKQSVDVTGKRLSPRKEPIQVPIEMLLESPKKVQGKCIGFLLE